MLAFPDSSNFFDEKTLSRVGRDLRQAGMVQNAGAWLSLSLLASATLFVLSFLVFFLFLNVLQTLAASLFSFALFFLAFLKYPSLRKKKRAEEIEASLSVALRTASIELNSGASFEKILRDLSAQQGVLGQEFSRVYKEVKSGASVSHALNSAAERVDSLSFKNACMQLSFAYEHGLRSDSLRKLAEELVSLQKARAKEFSGKQAFLTLLFVAVSCVVPALFAAYVIVGSSFMKLSFGRAEILFAFCLLFPLLDLAILLYLREKTPCLLAA